MDLVAILTQETSINANNTKNIVDKADKPKKLVTNKELAVHLDLSAPYISTLMKNGILPAQKSREGVDIDHCRIAYINYLRSKARLHLKDGSGDITEERLRLVKNQADQKQLEVAVMAGNLVDAEDVISTWQNMIGNCRSKLLNIPAKITHQVIGLTEYAEIEDLITNEVHEALNELARDPLPEAAKKDLGAVDSDVPSSEAAEG